MPKSRPSPADNAPRLDAITHRLDNGLELLVREDPSHPLVSVQIWVRAGSIHEEEWTGGGLAHCVEHMIFKGTERRSAEALSQDIQAAGGYVNAYTTFNRTVYWIDGLADQTAAYLDVLADMMQCSRLEAGELAREQDVIRREMAMDLDDPDSTLHHLMQETAFRRHPLKHPIIGHRSIFDQMGQSDVRHFVDRHYVPNNCFVVIAGAVKARTVVKQVEKAFGHWERRPYEPVPLPVEPTPKGDRHASRRFQTDLARLSLGWRAPGESHPDKAVLDVLGFILGSGRSSRLHQELRERSAISHAVGAYNWGAQDLGLFEVASDCEPDRIEANLASLQEQVTRMAEEGPSETELEKAIRATRSGQLRSMVTTRGQANSLGTSWLLTGSTELPQHYLRTVQRLTPSRLQSMAQDLFSTGHPCEVVVSPSVQTRSTSRRRRSSRSELSLHEIDGLRVAIQSNARLPLVSIRTQFLAGVLAETSRNAGVSLVSAQLSLKGTRSRSASEIQSTLENLGGSLQCTADAHRRIYGADVMAGDEVAALELISDLMTAPQFPEEGLEVVKKRQMASIREEQEDPLTVALRRARAEVFAGRPFARTALGTEDSVSSLSRAQCRSALQKTVRRGNGVITVVGDVDRQQTLDQITEHLQAVPAGTPAYDPAKRLVSRSKGGHWEQALAKEQAALVVGFRTVDLLHKDTPVFTLIDEACSDMGSRLFNRIREELGLAYYVGAQHFSALSGGALYFYLGTAPEQLDQAEAEMRVLLSELCEKGLTPAELDRAKTTWKSSWLRAQQGNGAMADVLGWNLLNGLGEEHFHSLPQRIAGIQGRDVKRLTRAYLDPANAFTVRVTPGS